MSNYTINIFLSALIKKCAERKPLWCAWIWPSRSSLETVFNMRGETVRHEENTTSKVHKYSKLKQTPKKPTVGKLFRKISLLSFSCTRKKVVVYFKKGDVTNVKSQFVFSLTDVKALGK